MFKSKSNKSDKAASSKQPVFKQEYFNNCHRTYSCIHCRAHLANHDELISKLFQGNHGRAYLFNKVVNIGCKQAVQRELLTGLHAVADIYCDSCETTLGWKYEQAFVPSQKYKEGKYIIELVHMLKENDWDLTSYNARDLLDEAELSCRRQIESELAAMSGDGRRGFRLGSGDTSISYIGSSSRNTFRSFDDHSQEQSGCLEDQEVREEARVSETTSKQDDQPILGRLASTCRAGPNDDEEAALALQQTVKQPSDLNGTVSGQSDSVSPAGIELIERSIDMLQLAGTNSRNQNTSGLKSPQHQVAPVASPKDSLCSSRSQSDISSSISVTDSTSSTTDEASSPYEPALTNPSDQGA